MGQRLECFLCGLAEVRPLHGTQESRLFPLRSPSTGAKTVHEDLEVPMLIAQTDGSHEQ